MAQAVGDVLTSFGHLTQAAENVSAREILRGVTKVLPRRAEVVSGGMVVTMVAMVVVVAMGAMVAVVAMVVVMMMMVMDTAHR